MMLSREECLERRIIYMRCIKTVKNSKVFVKGNLYYVDLVRHINEGRTGYSDEPEYSEEVSNVEKLLIRAGKIKVTLEVE